MNLTCRDKIIHLNVVNNSENTFIFRFVNIFKFIKIHINTKNYNIIFKLFIFFLLS